MNNLHNIQRPGFQPIQPQSKQSQPAQKVEQGKFQELLQNRIDLQDGIKFSGHAMDRLRMRNISLNSGDMLRLNQAVNKAEGKGSKDSLVLMNDTAFVVSVKNKTVVTALSYNQMKDHVVTNIDSTVMA